MCEYLRCTLNNVAYRCNAVPKRIKSGAMFIHYLVSNFQYGWGSYFKVATKFSEIFVFTMAKVYKYFDWCPKIGIEAVELNVTTNNVTIIDSFKIKHLKQMLDVVNYIKTINSTSISKHSIFSMLSEWRSHNLLYWLGIFNERTKHCDLNFESSYKKIGYIFLSLFYMGQ